MAQVTSLRTQAERARRRSNRVEDDETAALLLADAAKYGADADRLAASLAKEDGVERSAPETLELNVGTLVAVLTAIVQAPGPIPHEAANVITKSLVNFSVVLDNDRPNADISFNLEVPVNDDEVALIGPIHGSVEVYGRPRTNTYRTLTERRGHEILRRLAEGETQDEIIASLRNVSEHSMRECLAREAVSVGLSSRVSWIVFTSPIPELHCLFARLIRSNSVNACREQSRVDLEAWVSENLLVPDGANPAWAALALSSYLSAEPPRVHWAARNVLQTKAIRILEECGGHAMLSELRNQYPEFDEVNFRGCVYHRRSPWEPVLSAEKVTTSRPTVRRGGFHKDMHVSLWKCTHCDGNATLPLQAVEIPGHLLCPTCHRSPMADSPIFPDSYFDLPTQILRGSVLGPTSHISPERAEEIVRRAANPRVPTSQRVMDVDARARQAICDAYEKGEMSVVGPHGICETFGVKIEVVYRIIDAAGVERRHGKVNRRMS